MRLLRRQKDIGIAGAGGLEKADLAEASQRPFLEAACGNDRVMLEEVLALLAEDRRGRNAAG